MSTPASEARSPASGFAQGISIMVPGVMLLPVMDTIAKYLATSHGIAPAQVAFYRFVFQFVATAPVIVMLHGVAGLRPSRWWLNVVRGALLGGASLCFFTAVKFMPLADSIAIFFVEPFILTMLSALILHEEIGWRRWVAIAIGFVGAIIVINPSFARFGSVALFPLVTATLFASYMLMNRALGTLDSPLTMQCVAAVGGSLFLGIVLLAGGAGAGVRDLTPSLPGSAIVWSLLVVLGVIAAYSHLLIVGAFQKAPASLLAPFQYLEIVSATLLGYIVFADFPDPSKLFGILIVVGAGLFVFWRERQLQLENRRSAHSAAGRSRP